MCAEAAAAAAFSDTAHRNPIGTHVQVGKGLVKGALAATDDAGYETLQVFVGNPRGWALAAGDPAEDAAFRTELERRGMRAFIHAPYLINLGSPNPVTYERSAALLAHNLERAARMGVEGVVVHTGSAVAGPYDAAMRQVREALLPILDRIAGDDAPWLLLEPTAGQGRSLCAGVEDLPGYLEALDRHPKAGICLDTCHVFAAGAPLDEPGGAARAVDDLVATSGPGRLRLIHANDSADVRGSLKDRHAPIGAGRIGEAAFAELFAHPATAGVPFILETPGSRAPANPCLAALRRLRERSTAAPTR